MNQNLIAVYGEVPELVEKKSNEIVQSYLEEDKDDFNFIKFNLYETEINTVIEETLTLPFFSNKKAILVKNAFVFTGEKVSKELTNHITQLDEFINNYDGDNLIIFEIYQNKLDERKKITKSLKKNGQLKKTEQMSEEDLKKWVKDFMHENYKEIKEDALNLLIELTGVNFNIINQEVNKLILFIGDRPTINRQDVSLIINRSLEQNVFLLTELIQKGKKQQAISLVKDLITMKEEPIKLLALVTSNYRLYYQCKILSQKGYSGNQIAKTIGVHPYLSLIHI